MKTMNDDTLRTLIKNEADERQVWDASPDLQEDFAGSFDGFKAYVRHELGLAIPDTGATIGTGLHSREETIQRIRAVRFIAEATAKLDGTGYPDSVLQQLDDDLLPVVWDGSAKLRAEFSGDFNAYKTRVAQLRAGVIKPTVAG